MNLKEFSALLGISQTTISRALNGYPEVNADTRQRILQEAARTGYRPNASARRLATGKQGSIGLVMPIDPDNRTDIHFSEFLNGLGEVAAQRSFNLVIKPTEIERQDHALKDLAVAGSVDGVFFAYMKVKDPRIASMKKLKVPYLVHGRSYGSDDDFPFLDIDNRQAFADATNLLLQLGHRRFGILNGPKDFDFTYRRLQGVEKTLADNGLSMAPSMIFHGAMNDEDGYRGIESLLDQPNPPTAILCSSTAIALGAIRSINQRGLRLGTDISLIAHDDVLPFLKPENFSTPLTTTRSSLREAGLRVGTRLIAAIQGDNSYPHQEVWRADLIVRASTGPAPSP